MATTKTVLPDIKARPYDATQLKEVYDDTDVAASGISAAAAKTAVTTAANTEIDEFEGVYDAGIVSFKSGVDDLFTTFKSAWPFEDEAAFILASDTLATGVKDLSDFIPADFPQLKTDVETATDAAIDGLTAIDTTFHDILDTVAEDYQGLAESDTVTNPPSGLTFTCPQCLTTGLAPIYNPDGTATGETIQCPTCEGYGKTAVQYIIDPNSKTYIVAP